MTNEFKLQSWIINKIVARFEKQRHFFNHNYLLEDENFKSDFMLQIYRNKTIIVHFIDPSPKSIGDLYNNLI